MLSKVNIVWQEDVGLFESHTYNLKIIFDSLIKDTQKNEVKG